ncbi:hypothetical protein DPMN_073313 [Dreissena polymorpha]|uniref:Uncharacterized protein n=1 Tax=Dreissena polymorpha TaxID=45954 RepID=A0A9D4BYY4_DREPO|nr:hypothetical protein DPMN_073313 [Dreissena polymorpha]
MDKAVYSLKQDQPRINGSATSFTGQKDEIVPNLHNKRANSTPTSTRSTPPTITPDQRRRHPYQRHPHINPTTRYARSSRLPVTKRQHSQTLRQTNADVAYLRRRHLTPQHHYFLPTSSQRTLFQLYTRANYNRSHYGLNTATSAIAATSATTTTDSTAYTAEIAATSATTTTAKKQKSRMGHAISVELS